MTITIYTDGSCIGNPGPGGWAALIIFDETATNLPKTAPHLQAPQPNHHLFGHEADTTNNRMEMQAIIQALAWLNANLAPTTLQDASINLYSDSNLIIQTLNQGWKRKANTDLWAELDKQRAWLNIHWNWVKAHATNKLNNLVDQLANSAARSQ